MDGVMGCPANALSFSPYLLYQASQGVRHVGWRRRRHVRVHSEVAGRVREGADTGRWRGWRRGRGWARAVACPGVFGVVAATGAVVHQAAHAADVMRARRGRARRREDAQPIDRVCRKRARVLANFGSLFSFSPSRAPHTYNPSHPHREGEKPIAQACT